MEDKNLFRYLKSSLKSLLESVSRLSFKKLKLSKKIKDLFLNEIIFSDVLAITLENVSF